MNRLLHILLTAYFTLVSSGILYSRHSCGESVSRSVYGISIGSGSKCCCPHDSAGHDKGCCESETRVLKAETEKFNAPSNFKVWKPLEIILFHTGLFEIHGIEFQEPDHVFTFVHPPPEPPAPVFILNRKLLI